MLLLPLTNYIQAPRAFTLTLIGVAPTPTVRSDFLSAQLFANIDVPADILRPQVVEVPADALLPAPVDGPGDVVHPAVADGLGDCFHPPADDGLGHVVPPGARELVSVVLPPGPELCEVAAHRLLVSSFREAADALRASMPWAIEESFETEELDDGMEVTTRF